MSYTVDPSHSPPELESLSNGLSAFYESKLPDQLLTWRWMDFLAFPKLIPQNQMEWSSPPKRLPLLFKYHHESQNKVTSPVLYGIMGSEAFAANLKQHIRGEPKDQVPEENQRCNLSPEERILWDSSAQDSSALSVPSLGHHLPMV